jgi:hypothetical protein
MAPAQILGASWGSFGTLLISVGAVLLAFDALYARNAWGRLAWLGTFPHPAGRFVLAAGIVGATLIALGSLVLLVDSRDLSALAIVVVLGVSGALVWVGVGLLLWRHLEQAWYGDKTRQRRSVWWCLRHPLFVNEEAMDSPEATELAELRVRKWGALTDEEAEKIRYLEAKIAAEKAKGKEKKRQKRHRWSPGSQDDS